MGGPGKIKVGIQVEQNNIGKGGDYKASFVLSDRKVIEDYCGGQDAHRIKLPQSFRLSQHDVESGKWVLIYDWFKQTKPIFDKADKKIREIEDEDHKTSIREYKASVAWYLMAEYLWEQSEKNKQAGCGESISDISITDNRPWRNSYSLSDMD